MTIEAYAIKQINTLISEYDELEIEIYIDDVSYSVDFFVTKNGEKKQCLDLIDDNIVSNKEYEEVARIIVEYARKSEEYEKKKINQYHYTIR